MAGVRGSRDEDFWSHLDELQRRIRQLEVGASKTLTFVGPRTDNPRGDGSGLGRRVEIGLTGGRYGLRVWAADGTLTIDSTTA